MPETGPRPTLLVGLDGATWSVLDPLMDAGVMPCLARLLARGTRAVLRSTPHPLTPPAWTTLMTGRTPGHHGVFDFVRPEQDGDHPRYTLMTSSDVHCETIWSIASRHGCRVTTLNFPCMFPPRPLNGFVVPGFVPWRNLPRAVHPRELYARIKALPEFDSRELAMDWDIERQALQGLPPDRFEPWIRFHTARERHWFAILSMLMREEPCELTAVMFDGVDKLQHLCYPYIATPAGPGASPWELRIRELCREYYRQVDGFIGRIVEQAGARTRVFLASDHGFTEAADRIFYVNVWLERHGYLRWADGVPLDEERRLTLEGHTGSDSLFDWGRNGQAASPRTTAFALTASSNGIFIRQARRPGEAGVPAGAYAEFRERLRRELLAWRDEDSGLPVVAAVLTREEAFPGGRAGQAPDLTLTLWDRSFISVLRAKAPLMRRRAPYGTHHPDGIFAAAGPGIRVGTEAPSFPIADVAATLLYSLGLPVPADFEGRPAEAAFEPLHLARHPVLSGPPTVSPDRPAGDEVGQVMNTAEEAEVLERLKALGYLE